MLQFSGGLLVITLLPLILHTKNNTYMFILSTRSVTHNFRHFWSCNLWWIL